MADWKRTILHAVSFKSFRLWRLLLRILNEMFTTECFFPIRALTREKQTNKRFVSLVPRRTSQFTSFPVAEFKDVSSSHLIQSTKMDMLEHVPFMQA